MSFDTKKAESLRKPFTIVELHLDINDPAQDSTFALQSDSYGTPKTTDDPAAYTGVDFRVYAYADQEIFGYGGHFPGLVKVISTPPKIDPGKSLGFRATATIELTDFISDDSFELPSPYDDRRVTGSHFLKLFARNHLKNRRLKVIRGYDPFNYDLSNCEVEHYIIDSFTYPDRNGRVTIRAIDELILLERKKAKAPLVSKGELASSITTASGTLDYSSEDPDEYGAVSATGYVAIEKEIMAYTVSSVTATGGTLTLTRAQFGTELKAHDAGESIQKCIVYNDENIIDIITDLITNHTNIPSSWIPTTDWNTLKTGDLANYNLTRAIYKPEDVKSLLNELVQLAGLSVYADIVNQEIVILAFPDFSTTVIDLNEDEHIEQGTLRVRQRFDQQITRQAIFWDKFDATESDEEKNFRKKFQVIDGTAESDADISNTSEAKTVKSSWLENSAEDNQLATSFAQRQINRFSQVPLEVEFELDQKYVGTVTGGRVWLGAIFSLTSSQIVDGGLNPVQTNFQCTSIRPVNNRLNKWQVTGLSYVSSAVVDADLYIDEDKTDYLLTDDLNTTEAREYVVVINSGVKICASSTANAAFRQGTFFSGATLKLINLGQILGHGGDGGTGGSMSAYPTCTAGTPGDGSAGGDALELTTDATIDNSFGLIYGGGGGASGALATVCFFDTETSTEFSVGGQGGGGGQGCSGGSGGAGGTGNTASGSAGDNGSISGPGENGVRGGEWGEAGDSEGGASGGAGGKAIELNGNSVTITAGNNSEQIKGAVS